MSVIHVVIGLAGICIGAVLALYFYIQKLNKTKSSVSALLANARKEADNIKRENRLEAKDEALRIKHQAEKEARQKLQEVRDIEKKLVKREYYLDRKTEVAEKKLEESENRLQEIQKQKEKLAKQETEIEQLKTKQVERLERIAGLSKQEAKNILMEDLLEDAKRSIAAQVRTIKDRAYAEANREAKKIIVSAIQRSAADHTAETTVSLVNLPNDNMKGRIIGREGRNIRHFESMTGVEIIVDDTPEAVVLSGFDPVRREIARITLEKLIQDGRIHPTRIEEMYNKAKKEVDESINQAAEDAIDEVSLPPLPKDLMKYLGKLQYRTSYGQNVLKHSIEVAWLAGLMAAELGLDGGIAKRAGLLHDIGKSVDRNVTGTHAALGADIAKRFNEKEEVINAIASHHEEVEATNPISVLVQAADQISGSRRGARGDTLENYIQRLEKLENIAESFDGVSKTYAIQAGREVRVIVENSKISDDESGKLSDDIAHKIENELTFPGQIKVVVVREHRSVSYAK